MSMRHLLILAQPSNLVFGTVTIWYVGEQTLVQTQIVQKASALIRCYFTPFVDSFQCERRPVWR